MNSIRVLIVEDEKIVALDIRRNLKKAGYETVEIVASGEEALSRFRELSPDLILMDIHLQGEMDGLETARAIRKEYRVPVILLTAFADDSTIERAIVSEPFGYIIKPFEQKELKIAIEMALYRHRLEKQLYESEERFRRLFEEDLSGDFIADGAGNLIMRNDAFNTIFGYPAKPYKTITNLNQLFIEETDRESFWTRVRREKKIHLFETEFQTLNEKRVTVLANVIGSFTDDGELNEVKGYLIDTTERRNLERRLQQAQKLEAIGRLAGGLAHDFNNILTVIMGYSSILSEKNAAGEPIDNEIEGIKKITQKASILIRQLLAFSRRQVLKPETVDVNALIKDMEKMLRRLISEDIRITISADSEERMIFVDPSKIELVLMNLVVNARDAMPDGGTITIETKNVFLEIPSEPADETDIAGLCVRIDVTDTGTGIPEEHLDKIFEPFFTTKTENKGTGLGLASVYGIIRQSGGMIKVKSLLNKGTCFSLFFPVTTLEVGPEDTDSPMVVSDRGSERILVVDDEDLLRSTIQNILSLKGYHVIVASNAGEALLMIEEQKMTVDLLLTDLIMPHINGDRLAARLKKSIAGLNTLVMSGYPPSMFQEKGINLNGIDIIAKPFKPEELTGKIREILDRRS